MSSPAAKAAGFDLATFCGPTPPPEATLLQIYKDQCPAWVISQFEAASTAQAATTAGADSTQTGKDLDNLTKQIEQLQKLYPQATVNQRLATPATSFSAATHYATRKQSELIYKSAEAIGRALSNGLAGKGEGSVLLLVGSTAEEQLLPPVDASLVSGDLKFLQDQLGGKICTAADISITIPRGGQAQLMGMDDIVGAATVGYAAEALLGTLATIIRSLGPSLDSGTATATLEPSEIIKAGVISGIAGNKSAIRTTLPPIADNNTVLVSLKSLREGLVKRQKELAPCKEEDPEVKRLKVVQKQIQDYLLAIQTKGADGKQPSLLEGAVRRASIAEGGVSHVLVIGTATNGGSVATFHPTFWRAPSFLAMADIALTYRLATVGGVSVDSGSKSGTSRETMSVSDFATAGTAIE